MFYVLNQAVICISLTVVQAQQYSGPVPPRPFFSNAVPAQPPSAPQRQSTIRQRGGSGRAVPQQQPQASPRLLQSSQISQAQPQPIRLRRPQQQSQPQQITRARVSPSQFTSFDNTRNSISDEESVPPQYLRQTITGPTPVPSYQKSVAPQPVKPITPKPVIEDDYSKEEDEYDEDEPIILSTPSTTASPLPAIARTLGPIQASPAPVQFSRPQGFQPAGFRPSPQYRPEPIKSVFPIDSLPFQNRPTPRPAPQIKPQPTPEQRLPYSEEDEDDEPIQIKRPIQRVQAQPQIKAPQPSRQPVPQQLRQQSQSQVVRQQQLDYVRPQVPKQQGKVTSSHKERKPVPQIIRKYQEENEDGSITWGYENDDGSFKEETIGVDCVTRGKYGYVDPDGVRREYTYSTGIPCDRQQEEAEAAASAADGYIDYTNNKYVLPNGDEIDLEAMVKNRARKPVSYKYRN